MSVGNGGDQSRRKLTLASRALAGGTALALVLSVSHPAAAQSTQLKAQVQLLQQQIQALQQQIQSLQQQVDQSDAKAQQAQQTAQAAQIQALKVAAAPVAAPSPGPHVTKTPSNRFGLESADGQYSIALTGRLMFDFGDYPSYQRASKFTSPADLTSGINARRARLGVVGKFAGDWNYTFIYDLGQSSDSVVNANSGSVTSGIENAFITYNGLYNGNRPFKVAFDLGYQDVPYTMDEAVGSNDIMFMERASSQVIANNIAAGDFRSALGVRSNDDRYWGAVYLTGPQSGASHVVGEQYGAFGRFAYQLLQTPEYSVHLGVDAEGLIKAPSTPASFSSSSGAFTAPSSIQTLTLSDRPELRVDPSTIINTGTLGSITNPVTSAAVYSVEAAAGWRNLYAQGEYFWYEVNRQNLQKSKFDGGYVEGSWVVTGEQRKYNPTTGAYPNPVPAHPFSLANGTFGALELAARFSYLNLNDDFVSGKSVAGSSTQAVAGGMQQILAFGLNWYPNPNMRFMIDYLHGSIEKENGVSPASKTAAPLGALLGTKFDAIGLRTQVYF